MSVLFVAEVCSNHNGDLERCLQIIERAARVGCGAVKFQLFKVTELFAPEVLARSPKHSQRSQWELPLEYLPQLAKLCRELHMRFACSPFYLGAVEELEPHVDFFKISSYELLWEDLLVACARSRKPVVLSTGMATLDEVAQAVEILRREGCQDLSLLHCVSGYPVQPEECNLAALKTLRRNFHCPVGWSDHSARPGVIHRAVHRWGASLIEFHLDLDAEGFEYSSGHCWLPEEIAPVIETVNQGLEADGDGAKEPRRCEAADREWRAEVSDGLRPRETVRKEWRN